MLSDSTVSSRQPYLRTVGIIGLVVAAGIVISGLWLRYDHSSELKDWTDAQAIPTVSLVHPVRSDKPGTLVLPGDLQAYYDAPIYARVSGYVHKWYKDIGAKVGEGDVLADIDTPELDQQITQAEADVADAAAARTLAQTTSARWTALLAQDAVSQQEADEKSGDLTAKTARMKAAQANLDRLRALKTFARITAPFAGVVTQRTADIGSLVNAGAEANGHPLFAVADIHRIRVYVRVPQSDSAQIHQGMTATLSVPEFPGKTFQAVLSSTSNAINQQSGTLLVELQADNADGELKPGSYAQVTLALPAGSNALVIPASTLLFRRDGLQVATLGANNHIVMKSITMGRDLGDAVEVRSGLSTSDEVVNTPPDSLANGDLVRVSNENPSGRQ